LEKPAFAGAFAKPGLLFLQIMATNISLEGSSAVLVPAIYGPWGYRQDALKKYIIYMLFFG